MKTTKRPAEIRSATSEESMLDSAVSKLKGKYAPIGITDGTMTRLKSLNRGLAKKVHAIVQKHGDRSSMSEAEKQTIDKAIIAGTRGSRYTDKDKPLTRESRKAKK